MTFDIWHLTFESIGTGTERPSVKVSTNYRYRKKWLISSTSFKMFKMFRCWQMLTNQTRHCIVSLTKASTSLCKSFFQLAWNNFTDGTFQIWRNSFQQIGRRKLTTSRALSFNLDEASAWVLEVKDLIINAHIRPRETFCQNFWGKTLQRDTIIIMIIFIIVIILNLLVLTCRSSTSRIASFRKVSERCLAASASWV